MEGQLGRVTGSIPGGTGRCGSLPSPSTASPTILRGVGNMLGSGNPSPCLKRRFQGMILLENCFLIIQLVESFISLFATWWEGGFSCTGTAMAKDVSVGF